MMSDQHRTLAIASDHRGHDVVDAIHDHLTAAGWTVDILARPDDLDAPVDYPDAARAVTTAVVDGRAGFGVRGEHPGRPAPATFCNIAPESRIAGLM